MLNWPTEHLRSDATRRLWDYPHSAEVDLAMANDIQQSMLVVIRQKLKDMQWMQLSGAHCIEWLTRRGCPEFRGTSVAVR